MKVAISNESFLVRTALIHLFEAEEFDILARELDSRDLVKALRSAKSTPDVIVTQVSESSNDDLWQATVELRDRYPDSGFLLLVRDSEPASLRFLFEDDPPVGLGLLAESDVSDSRSLMRAVEVVTTGGRLTSSSIRESRLINQSSSLPEELGPREIEVLQLLSDGYSNSAIARILAVGVSSVERYVRNIFDSLGLFSESESDMNRRVLAAMKWRDAVGASADHERGASRTRVDVIKHDKGHYTIQFRSPTGEVLARGGPVKTRADADELLRKIRESRSKGGRVGKWEVYEHRGGGYRFRLRSGDGEIVMTSEALPSRNYAKLAIDQVSQAVNDSRAPLTS